MISLSNGRSRGTRTLKPPDSLRSHRVRLLESRLQQSGYGSLRDVACDDCDGTLRLRGCVPSQYLKQLALEAASGLPGEGPIVIEIEVVSPRSRASAGPAEIHPPRWGRTTAPRAIALTPRNTRADGSRNNKEALHACFEPQSE